MIYTYYIYRYMITIDYELRIMCKYTRTPQCRVSPIKLSRELSLPIPRFFQIDFCERIFCWVSLYQSETTIIRLIIATTYLNLSLFSTFFLIIAKIIHVRCLQLLYIILLIRNMDIWCASFFKSSRSVRKSRFHHNSIKVLYSISPK